jgi:hypothetical protein
MPSRWRQSLIRMGRIGREALVGMPRRDRQSREPTAGMTGTAGKAVTWIARRRPDRAGRNTWRCRLDRMARRYRWPHTGRRDRKIVTRQTTLGKIVTRRDGRAGFGKIVAGVARFADTEKTTHIRHRRKSLHSGLSTGPRPAAVQRAEYQVSGRIYPVSAAASR